MSPCRKSTLAILLVIGAATNGCGSGFHLEPGSSSVATVIPTQSVSKYAGNWSGTWQTNQVIAPQNDTMTLSIDNTGKMTGQIHDSTTQQDGALTGQLQT